MPLGFAGDFELVSGDLTHRNRLYLGWLIVVQGISQWLLAFHLIGEKAGAFFLILFGILFFCVYGFSDELRAMTLVTDYRPLIISCVLFESASWVAVFLAWIPGAVVSGLALVVALAGLAMTLGTARPPMRYPNLVLEGWRLLFRRPEILSPSETASRLPKALMLLRSFPADANPIETVDMEFGYDAPGYTNRIFFTATLEATIRLFASQQRLEFIKLGGESMAEGAAMVLSNEQYWKTVVVQMMDQSPAILLVPNTTPGLVWEVEQLVRSGWFESKVSFVFPKLPSEQLEFTWTSFCALVRQFGVVLPLIPYEREWQPLVARFDGRGRIVAVALSRWTTGPCRRAYWYALRRCLSENPDSRSSQAE